MHLDLAWILLISIGPIADPGVPPDAPNDSPGNVLLVVLDDIGNDYIGIYGEGPAEDQPPTPNIDALAAKGVRFVNAYSNPACSPTRATLMTGRYGFRTGYTHNFDDVSLSLSERTLPEELGPAGYSTLMLGKWHLGEMCNAFVDPLAHGWFLFRGTKGNMNTYDRYKYFTLFPWHLEKQREDVYPATKLTDDALFAMSQLPEPWLISANHHLVHGPVHVPPDHLHHYDNPITDQEKFMAMVEAMDTEVGRILDQVDLETTTVILLGDNGTEGRFSEYTAAKGHVFEAGVNVPLIIAGVGVTQPGTVTEALANTTDVYATILDLAGLPSFAEDSSSLRPILEDPTSQVRDWVYAELTNDLDDRQMVRGERYKLIRYGESGFEALYDLELAPPNGDGDPLCLNDCPDGLDDVEEEAYHRLATLLDGIRDS